MASSSIEVLKLFEIYRRQKTIADKRAMIVSVLNDIPDLFARRNLLVKSLNYDILNPEADGENNILRRSEISIALLREIFKHLPVEINREKFLGDLLISLCIEAQKKLTQGILGSNPSAPAYTLFYNLFVNMVFFHVGDLSEEEFERYGQLALKMQVMKNQMNYKILNTDPYLVLKFKNTLTLLEKFKLDFLWKHYGLKINMIAEACQRMFPRSNLLNRDVTLIPMASSNSLADKLQMEVLLELNKLACGQNHQFGKLFFEEAKPLPNVPLAKTAKDPLVLQRAAPELEASLIRVQRQKNPDKGKKEETLGFYETCRRSLRELGDRIPLNLAPTVDSINLSNH